jgi:hypothetical protein
MLEIWMIIEAAYLFPKAKGVLEEGLETPDLKPKTEG